MLPALAIQKNKNYTILCNPHIARNEEIQLAAYRKKDNMRHHYLGHLHDVIMVDPHMLAAERLGGADYDGDMIPTIEPLIRDANDWEARYETVKNTFCPDGADIQCRAEQKYSSLQRKLYGRRPRPLPQGSGDAGDPDRAGNRF